MAADPSPRGLPERPRQAVVLAGGRGARLGTLTDSRPKPMIEIHGRPFLAYLIEMLREQGFTRVLLLLGYLPDLVRDHFGDGKAFGIDISYSITPPADLTVRRIKAARPQLDGHFLLMSCDSYWPLRFDAMWREYLAAGVPALTTVYSNKDGYSRDSVRVGFDGFVELFDPTRTTPGLKGIDISYAILQRRLVDRLPDHDMPIEEALYPMLIRERQLTAHVTDHRYYSVSSPDRLPLTEIFLAREPAVILDRDSVLDRRPASGMCVRGVAGFEWLPGALEALRAFREAGYRVLLASNQAGLARGDVSVEALEAIHDAMREQAREAGGSIDAIYHCPHDWYAGCECRKPRPGLLFQAQRDFSLDLTRTCFLGDDERDLEAAAAAGATGRLITAEQPLLAHVRQLLSPATPLHS
jgi:D-glycero-D-manno-heptose 1,7-bisphosphate phosphatase